MSANIDRQSAITLVVTSCQRHDLLEKTLRSFDHYNALPIQETIVCEDSDLPAPEWLQQFPNLGPKTWIANGNRKGQIYSIDRAYAEVKTPLIFHLEDDWEFCREGFMEESLAILAEYPNIVQCSIRDDWQHPSVTVPKFPFPINQPEWAEGWSGFCFNPGLRRKSDYCRIGSYGRHVSYYPRFVGELALSKLYRSLGYYAAALPAACRHIGEGNRHVAWETAPKAPKVLIAVPACHKHDYETHSDFGIHKNTASSERIDAVRATWQKDVQAFSKYVEMEFFFGGAANRQPLCDEVFLPVADAYDSLPSKVQAIYQWALAHGFDYVFKTDDDTFVYLDRLMASGFEQHDYVGYCASDPRQLEKDRYASGGSGYWVSRKAMKLLAVAPVDDWAEDRWVGKVLYAHGIKVMRDTRYLPGFDAHYVQVKHLPESHPYISFHACTPAMMQEFHRTLSAPNFQIPTIAFNEPSYAPAHKGLTFKAFERVEEVPVETKTFNGLRILIAILSCHARNVLPKVQRETWLKGIGKLPIEYRYFLGRKPAEEGFDPRRPPVGKINAYRPLSDEVILDVPDDYDSLPIKTRALLIWAYERGYHFVFKCDQDTYCHVERLLQSGFAAHSYSGHQRVSDYFGYKIEYAQGGAGYWLDRRAMECVIAEDATALRGGPEDINVARILAKKHIRVVNDNRYEPAMACPVAPENDKITAHQCTAEEMREIFQRFCTEPSTASSSELVQETNRPGMERGNTCEAQV